MHRSADEVRMLYPKDSYVDLWGFSMRPARLVRRPHAPCGSFVPLAFVRRFGDASSTTAWRWMQLQLHTIHSAIETSYVGFVNLPALKQ